MAELENSNFESSELFSSSSIKSNKRLLIAESEHEMRFDDTLIEIHCF